MSRYQFYAIRRERVNNNTDKQVNEVTTQRKDQTKLEMEHNKIEAEQVLSLIGETNPTDISLPFKKEKQKETKMILLTI